MALSMTTSSIERYRLMQCSILTRGWTARESGALGNLEMGKYIARATLDEQHHDRQTNHFSGN
jgi:hypothetical protein